MTFLSPLVDFNICDLVYLTLPSLPLLPHCQASAANHQFHHSANHREGLYPYGPSYLQQTFDNRNQMDGNNNNHNNNNNSSDNFGSKSMLTSEWEAYTTSKKPQSVLSVR